VVGWKFTGEYEMLEWGAVTSAVHEDEPDHTAYIYADKRYVRVGGTGTALFAPLVNKLIARVCHGVRVRVRVRVE
jgi:hypothetical protein